MEAESDPNANPPVSLVPLLLVIVFAVNLALSARWGDMRNGDVLGFNFFADVTVLFFIFLHRKTHDPTLPFRGHSTISAATIGPWTMIVAIPIFLLFLALQASSPGIAVGFLAIALVGFTIGLAMGSPRLAPRRQAGLALSIGYAGAFVGVLLSAIWATNELPQYRGSGPELIPVVVLSGILSVLVGVMCALGSLLGGFVRSRLVWLPAPA
jgi:hypothetical protein